MATYKTTQYYYMLSVLNTNDTSKRQPYIDQCDKLIAEFDSGELNHAIKLTLQNWKEDYLKKTGEIFYRFLEKILERGADPNAIDDSGVPVVYRIYETDLRVPDLLVKWGADIRRRREISYPIDKCTFSIIEYIVYYYFTWDPEQFPKDLILHLLELGAPDDLSGMKKVLHVIIDGEEDKHVYHYYKRAKLFLKLYKVQKSLQTKIVELENENKELRDYIFELEHRPPELGGPEYEAGKGRWEERTN